MCKSLGRAPWGICSASTRCGTMLVKEKHLAMLPKWAWNGLDPPQQQALRDVWCRNRHFAEVTAAGQLVMRVGRREVMA